MATNTDIFNSPRNRQIPAAFTGQIDLQEQHTPNHLTGRRTNLCEPIAALSNPSSKPPAKLRLKCPGRVAVGAFPSPIAVRPKRPDQVTPNIFRMPVHKGCRFVDGAHLRLAAQKPDGQEGPPWQLPGRVFSWAVRQKLGENQIRQV